MRKLLRTLVCALCSIVFINHAHSAENVSAQGLFETPVYTIKSEVVGLESEAFSLTIWNGSSRTVSKTGLPMVDGQIFYQDTSSVPLIIRVSVSDKRLVKPAGNRGYYPSKSASMWLVALPGSTVTLKGHLSDFPEVYPYGDEQNTILREFIQDYYPLLNASVNISVELAREDVELGQEKTAALKAEQSAINKQADAVLQAFLSRHPSSVAGLYFMKDSYIRKFIDTERLQALFAQVGEEYRETAFYQTIAERLNAVQYQPGNPIFEIQSKRTPDGTPFSTSSWKGKFYLIDFWGSWCMPCIADFPYLKALRDEFKGSLEVLGIASDREEAWRPAIKQHGLDWQHVLIGQGDQDFSTRLNVTGYPTKILVNPEGIIVYRSSGGGEDSFKKMGEIIRAYKAH